MKTQTVYLLVKVEDEIPNLGEYGVIKIITPDGDKYLTKEKWVNHEGEPTSIPKYWLKPQEAFVFTPEELNEYTAKVGKAFSESAAENIGFIETTSEKLNSEEYKPFITADDGTIWTIDKQKITNTFEEAVSEFKKTDVYINEIKQQQEQQMYSEEDMIEFAEFKLKNLMKHCDDKGMYLGNKKVFQLWEEQRPKKVWYE